MRCGSLVEQVIGRYENRVRDCRLRALIAKQDDLARLSGINRSTINALENNKLFLSAAYALRLREIFRCALDDLYAPKREAEEAEQGGVGRAS